MDVSWSDGMNCSVKEAKDMLLAVQQFAAIEKRECEKYSWTYFRMGKIIDLIDEVLGVRSDEY